MPDKNDEYLVYSRDAVGVESADWIGGQWMSVRAYGYDSHNRDIYNVSHWRPLPSPPAGHE